MFKLKLFDLCLSEETGRMDDAAFHEFVADKELIGCTEHFFVRGVEPHLLVMVRYREMGQKHVEKRGDKNRGGKRDWRGELSETEQSIYDGLRAWRKDRAQQEGVPVYMVMTNQQLAEVSRQKPNTLAGLRTVQGVGKATVENYGAELLECLRELCGVTTEQEASSSE